MVLQAMAVVLFLASVLSLGWVLWLLARPASAGNTHLTLDLTGCALPFPLWYLGLQLRRRSEEARKVALAGAIYLGIVGIVALTFLLFSGGLKPVPLTWKLMAYGWVTVWILLSIGCAYCLRRSDTN
ncbi:MAG TPA: hypothetical protein VFV81_10405 [Verrucomicrobiae bacterium]|nr:hypothetical protein [Verrucomicrobiae bacterium]